MNKLKLEYRKASELAKNVKNWKVHPANQRQAFNDLFGKVGWAGALLLNEETDTLVDGHMRRDEFFDSDELVPVLVGRWTEEQEEAILLSLDPIAGMIEADKGALLALTETVATDSVALDQLVSDIAEEHGLLDELEANEPIEIVEDAPQIDKAEELQAVWQVQEGDLWQLGKHKMICGDCTDRATVDRLMDGKRADLVCADPPYGMGKEKDGIANDNLYREKLDAFQMAWWSALRPSVQDNGSTYIWGNAEDLWRLWYIGGLKDSERLTFRNEIVWDKSSGQGMLSEAHRMYPTGSERCIFFMLGEQGFNNNADNYWEGWEPIRLYLKGERDKMGWDIPTMKTLAGHSPKSGCHWFDSSQWTFVTEDVYNAWQTAAKGQAFKRDYEELKREFYSTRAYFDNTHENMTDVWNYQRVTGEERHGHATPKPVEMIARIIKSSCPVDGLTVDPFLGSGTTLIAAHQTNRICYGSEISPKYVAVCLQRYADLTGETPIKS